MPWPRRLAHRLLKMFEGKIPRQGTKTYMAPEQIRCESPTPTVDIYSLGISCYELACGRPPFRANSSQELLEKHLNERPLPLTAHNKLVTPEFNDLVLKMIQKRPADRFSSLHEFMIAVPVGSNLSGRPRSLGGTRRSHVLSSLRDWHALRGRVSVCRRDNRVVAIGGEAADARANRFRRSIK